MIRRALVLSLVLLALAALSPAHAATNLVANGSFDAGIAGWSKNILATHQIAWSPQDETGKPASGSLRVTNAAPGFAHFIFSDCFAVTPGVELVFGASAWAPLAGTTEVGGAQVEFFTDGACVHDAGDSAGLTADARAILGGATWGPIQGFGKVPENAVSAIVQLYFVGAAPPQSEVLFDNVYVHEGATCFATRGIACLGDGRFRVDAFWETTEAKGHAAFRSFVSGGDSAWATFFDPSNIELVVKVLDGCAINDRFWIFVAGLTDVRVWLRVYDTHGGAVWTHNSQLGVAYQPIQETSAFATCP